LLINWVCDTGSGAKIWSLFIGPALWKTKVVELKIKPPEKQAVIFYKMNWKSSE
jgi:hypothetical protein